MNADVVRLKKKSSGFMLSPALPTAGTRSRVEIKAIVFPSSLIDASRLSSAKKGAKVVEPADGTRLAGVLVIWVKVPAAKYCRGKSAKVVRSTSVTLGT